MRKEHSFLFKGVPAHNPMSHWNIYDIITNKGSSDVIEKTLNDEITKAPRVTAGMRTKSEDYISCLWKHELRSHCKAKTKTVMQEYVLEYI